MPAEKKSFRKFASKHLAGVIENRRKTKVLRADQKDRAEKRERKEKKTAQREEAEHQADLDKLKESDPQFYSYLEEDDPHLLQFGQMDEEAEVIGDEDGSDAETDEDQEDEAEGGEDAEEGASKMVRVSQQEIDTVIKSKSVSEAVELLTSAVRQLGYKVHEARTMTNMRKFEDPALVKMAISQTVKLAAAQLPSLLSSGKTPSFKDQNSRVLIKRVLNAAVSVMAEGSSDGEICAQICHAMPTFVKVMHLVRGITKVILRSVLQLCSHGEESTRIAAYMVVQAIAKRSAGTRSMYQSAVFKGLFLTLVRTSHKYTIHTLPVIGFLMSSVVDLYMTDMEASYQHAYVYIRQLAVHLRAALQDQSQHNIRAVFNWQFLNALRCWGLVVSTYHTPQQLGPLIHPVVQIATGLLDLFSSPRMFPMHLHVIEMLNHISSRSGVYIPVSTYLLRILASPSSLLEAGAANSGNNGEPVDLQFTMRIKKAQARSGAYRVQLWSDTLYLLVEHIAAHSHTIGFPETFWAVGSTLTKLKRETKVPKIHNMISVILGHVNTTVAQIKAKRDNVNFGPCDLESVKMFEDEMRGKNGALVTYYNSLRQSRVASFAAKQQNIKERTTLESVVERGQANRNNNNKHQKRGRN